jgi:MFS transporter, UMF1 family
MSEGTSLVVNKDLNPIATRKEVRSWYAIDWSNSVYATVAISGFLPLLIQSAALSAANFPYICPNISRNQTLINSIFPNTTVTTMYYLQKLPVVTCGVNEQCSGLFCLGLPTTTTECLQADGISIFPLNVGLNTDPTSYASISISVSVAVQAFLFLFFGAIVDYANFKKPILIISSIIGGISTIACAGIFPSTWYLGSILMVISNAAFGVTNVVYNAYLPLLVNALPEVRNAEAANPVADSSAASVDAINTLKSKANNELSNKGFAFGYIAGVVGIILSVPGILLLSEIQGYQVAMGITGIWWIGFTFFPYKYLLSRPGPDLPQNVKYVPFVLSSSYQTIKQICQLPKSALFLVYWMISSDAIFAIASLAGLFMNSQLDWGCFPKQIGILSIFLLTPLFAAIGNYAYLHLHLRYGFSTRDLYLATMISCLLIPIYGIFGLKQGWEIIPVGLFYGFQLGAYQSFSRSIFATLIPKGHETAFFSMYELTNKGSSAIAPLVFAIIQEYTGNLRYAFYFLFINILIPSIGVFFLDLKAGMREAAVVGLPHPSDIVKVNVVSNLTQQSSQEEPK